MVVYEICSAYVKFSENQCLEEYADYKPGMVFQAGVPWDSEAEYESLEEAQKDFAKRRSSVECKGGSLYITDLFLIKSEFSGRDEEGYPIPPVKWELAGDFAPLADTEQAEVLLNIWRKNTVFDTLHTFRI